jgi:hypothetical protein
MKVEWPNQTLHATGMNGLDLSLKHPPVSSRGLPARELCR